MGAVVETLRKSVLHPAEFFDESGPSAKDSLYYFFVLLFSPLGLLTSYLMSSLLLFGMVDSWYFILAAGIAMNVASLLFYSFVLHIFIASMGGKGGFGSTLTIACISSSPFLLSGFLPLVNAAALAYGLYIQFRGIRDFHRLTEKRVLASIALSSFLVVLVFLLFLYSPL